MGIGNRSSVQDMFFLMHGFNAEGFVIVLYGFFDASSTHDGSRVSALCGFLGTLEEFESLDARWNVVLNKSDWRNRPKEFHAYDCVHGFREFTSWSFAERLAIFGDLATVITESDVLALGSIVVAEHLPKLDPSDMALLQSHGLGTPLDLSLQYILQNSIRWTRDHYKSQAKEKPEIGIFFDEEPPQIAERCHAFCNLYQTKHGFGEVLKGIAFGNSEKFTALQAADMLAFCTYRLELSRRFNEHDKDFPVMPGFMRVLQGVANAGGGFDLDALKRLVAVIKANPSGQLAT